MRPRPLPIASAVVVLTTAVVVVLGYSVLLGLGIGLVLGLVVGAALALSQTPPKTETGSTLPAYQPDAVLRELESAFVKVKRVGVGQAKSPVEAQFYGALVGALRYLPAQPVSGAAEMWDTVRRELLNPVLSEVQMPNEAGALQKRIEDRCEALPITLRALATTMLPEGTASLATREGATFYLDNLHAMPALQSAAPGSAVEKLNDGLYFRVGDEIFLVKERFVYRCGGDVWHEVLGESLRDGSVRALEWEVDDHQLELTLQAEPALSLDEVGTSLSELKKMDDREEGSLTFRSESFRYDESDKATCQAVGSGEVDDFYYFDFIGTRTKHILGIERWGSESKAYLMKPIAVKDLEILGV